MRKFLTRLGNSTNWLPLILAVAVILYQYSINLAQATQPPSPEWSRSLTADQTTYNGATVPAVLPDGTIFLLTSEAHEMRIRQVKNGRMLQQVTQIPAQGAHRISAVAGQQVDYFWIEGQDLRHASVDASGKVNIQPETIATAVSDAASALVDGQAVVAVASPQGLTLLSRASGAWQQVGQIAGAGVENVSMQRAESGAVVAYVPAGAEQRDLRLVTYEHGAFGTPRNVGQVELRQGKDSLASVELALDRQWAYLLYVRSYLDPKQGAVAQPTLVSMPRNGGQALAPVALEGGALPEGRSAGLLVAPHALDGVHDKAMVVFVSPVSDAFHSGVVPVVGTFADGKLQQLALGYKGSTGFRPALASHGEEAFLTFAVSTSNDKWEVHVASTEQAWKTVLNARQPYDSKNALGATLLSLFQIYLPLMIGIFVFAAVFLVLGVGYMLALNWMERHGRWVFGAGVLLGWVSLLITMQIMLGKVMQTSTLPQWVQGSTLPFLLTTALALLLLPGPWMKLARNRYQNPLGAVALWGALSLLTLSLFLGPLIAHG